MSSEATPGQQNQPQLGLWDAISIIVGIIIGAGIYETPPGIFRMMPDVWTTFGVWAGCGILAFIGALCYAELATSYPRSGGDYVYLTRAYGPLAGYLFGWAQLAVIQTGSIGLMAYVFADYATRLIGVSGDYSVFFAAGAVIVMTALNVVGVKLGTFAQNFLTIVKVLGLIGIVIVGFAYGKTDREVVAGTLLRSDAKSVSIKTSTGLERTFTLTEDTVFVVNAKSKFEATHLVTKDGKTFSGAMSEKGNEFILEDQTGRQSRVEKDSIDNEKTKKKDEAFTAENKSFKVDTEVKVVVNQQNSGTAVQLRTYSSSLSFGAVAFAMVLVFLTYGGWNDAAFVAAEVRNQRRNIPLALMLGTFGVMVIYLVVNYAYVYGLGFEGAQDSSEVAADVLRLLPWEFGEKAMCILVMISALGAVNGLIFTSSRIYSTLGGDYSLFWILSQKSGGGSGSPIASLALQLLITLLMILSVGTTFGQSMLDGFLDYLGQEKVSWAGQGGFYSLLRCTAPIFWIFFLMTGFALFILRINDRHITNRFLPLPFFPLLPLIFCATCGYMVYSGIGYAGKLGYVGAVLVLAGLPFYIFSRRSNNSEQDNVGHS